MTDKDVSPTCPDCGVGIGEAHTEGCDIARCLGTGKQRLQCEIGDSGLAEIFGIPESRLAKTGPHDCGQQTWSGLWPGVMECREFGWYSYFRHPNPGEQYGQWVRCDADDIDASEDLNRLHEEAVWDPDKQRFVLPHLPLPANRVTSILVDPEDPA